MESRCGPAPHPSPLPGTHSGTKSIVSTALQEHTAGVSAALAPPTESVTAVAAGGTGGAALTGRADAWSAGAFKAGAGVPERTRYPAGGGTGGRSLLSPASVAQDA